MSRPYPEWWCDKVTVFNKYEDPQTNIITWYRTVVDECFWKNTGIKVRLGNVELDTDTVICRIPIKDNFLEYFKWVATPNDKMDNYFTIKQGDILVKGIVTDTIDEYDFTKSSNELIKKYKGQGCIIIDRFGINTGQGRGLPHYYASGV